MDEFDRYVQRFVGIVLDISNSNRLQDVSCQIIKTIPQIEGDDCFYVAGTGDLKKHRGEMIASVATYCRPLDFNLGKAMQGAMDLFSQQDCDALKTILVFTDCYNPALSYNVKICLKINEKRGLGNKFCVCGMGNYDRSLKKLCDGYAEFIHLGNDEVSRIIMERYNGK